MRLRVVVAITLTVAAYAASALLWRQVFPFRDGIAEFLPENTIAYVHVNLTPVVRRALRLHLDNLGENGVYPKKYDRIFLGTPSLVALRGAITKTDVRELGLVWHKPKSLPPQLSLIVGQRASAQPDVMPAETITVGGQDVRVFVVRVRAGDRDSSAPLRSTQDDAFTRTLRRQPVQAVLHPRALPIPALEAARHLLPEMITASGILSRHGFILRGDQKKTIVQNWSPHFPLIARSTRIELLSEPRPGTFQVIGLPVRALVEQLDLPFHGELRAAIEPFLPADADLLVDGDQMVAHMDAPVLQPPEIVLRSLAARFLPIARTRLLDGLSASVLIADPDAFEIIQTRLSRWALKTKDGTTRIFAERSGDFVYLATDETLLSSALLTPSPAFAHPSRAASERRGKDSAGRRSPSGRGGEGGGAGLRIPSACRLDAQSPFIVWPIHPQAVVTMSVDLSGSNIAFCGRILQSGI